MPHAVKTSRDEHLWNKAKSIARKDYPNAEGKKFWKIVMGIYNNMKGK